MQNILLVIPVFNHGGSIGRVVGEVRGVVAGMAEIGEVVLVDDGCTDGTGEILAGMSGVTVLRHARNRGKGAALLTAFEYGRERGFSHAITVDADGQHDAGDIPRLAAAAREHPEDLIIGWRDMDRREAGAPEIPASSKKGRDISRFWLRIQTGQDIPDSQCGLRVYPLARILEPPYRFRRFDFETEVLARAAWGGMKIRSIPVRCIYFAKSARVSHFRPVVDTLRGVWVNVFLVARRLLPVPMARLAGGESGGGKFGRWWKAGAWKTALREALRAGSSNAELATAFALGIFVGLTPFYFFQTVLVIYLARRLHLNIVAAVIGSQISIPPLAPVWFVLSYGVGNVLLHGQFIRADWGAFTSRMVPAFLLGSVVVASVVSGAGLVAARRILPRIRGGEIRMTNDESNSND